MVQALLDAPLNATLESYNMTIPPALESIIKSEVISNLTTAILQPNASVAVEQVLNTVKVVVENNIAPENSTTATAAISAVQNLLDNMVANDGSVTATVQPIKDQVDDIIGVFTAGIRNSGLFRKGARPIRP
jgi:hypothetical protein